MCSHLSLIDYIVQIPYQHYSIIHITNTTMFTICAIFYPILNIKLDKKFIQRSTTRHTYLFLLNALLQCLSMLWLRQVAKITDHLLPKLICNIILITTLYTGSTTYLEYRSVLLDTEPSVYVGSAVQPEPT